MPQVQHINTAVPQYAGPVMRSASPATTISEPPDGTSYEDAHLTVLEFVRKVEEEVLRLRDPRPEEIEANKEPRLLPRPKTREEERTRFVEVMANLRAEVKKVEENELFEQSVRRDTMIGLEPQPSTNDIDKLMRSMMGPAMHLAPVAPMPASTATPGVTWVPSDIQPPQPPSTPSGTDSSATTVIRRGTKGKGRLRPKAH